MDPETPPAATGGQRATAREFFAVVFRRRWVILGLFGATLGTVLFVAFGTPKTYVSTGLVLVRRGEQQSAMQPYRSITSDWEIELGSEVQTARSWPVLQRAQRTLDLERRGRAPFTLDERSVNVQVTGKTNVLEISCRDRDPQLAERGCDALVRAYIDYRQAAQLSYPEHFFDREIQQAADELRRWTERRREFSNQTGIVDIGVQRTNLIVLRSELEQRRAEAQSQMAEAASVYRVMGRLDADSTIDLPSLVQPSLNEGSIEYIKSRIVEQEGHVAHLRERYQDESPEVTLARGTLDTLRAMLRREMDTRRAISRSRMEVARAKLDAADRDLAGVDARMAKIPDLEAQVSEMDNQIYSWKERFADLSKSSDMARVNENTVPRISVILLQPASPAEPVNVRDYVRLGLAPAFSLVVGVGMAFFVDGLDLTVHTSGQAEEEVRLPVLATLTERKRTRGRPWRRRAEGTAA